MNDLRVVRMDDYKSGINLTYRTRLYDDWQPWLPPPRHSREKHYVRLKVICEFAASELRESDSVLVSLPQFLADSQSIIIGIFSQINIHMPPDCADIVLQGARSLCRGALAVDRYRRVIALEVNATATACMGSAIYCTKARSPATMTEDEREAQCSICLDALGQHIVLMMPCSHAFHNLCLLKWLEKNRTCPLCRCPIFAGRTSLTCLN